MQDEGSLDRIIARYRRVAMLMFAAAAIQALLCALIVFKLSALATAQGETLGAFLGQWLAPVDVHRQYAGLEVLAFEWLAKLARDAMCSGFLILVGSLMWNRARFHAIFRHALRQAIAETRGAAEQV